MIQQVPKSLGNHGITRYYSYIHPPPPMDQEYNYLKLQLRYSCIFRD